MVAAWNEAPAAGGLGECAALVRSAEALRFSAPELAVQLARRALIVGAAEPSGSGDVGQAKSLSMRAQAVLAAGLVRMSHHADAVEPAFAALALAEGDGATDVAMSVRLDLAACTREVGEPLLGCTLLRPVLDTEQARPSVRAVALGRLVGCIAHVGRRDDLEDALTEADRLLAADDELSPDGRRMERARLSVRAAAYHRWYGDTEDAADAAREGLTQLNRLRGRRGETERLRAQLVLELACALLDDGALEEAASVSEGVLAEPVRATSAAAVGKLMLAVSTRVHLPAGRVERGRGLLDQAVWVADRHGLDGLLADALTVVSQLDETAERPAVALESLRAARAAEQRRLHAMAHAARHLLTETSPNNWDVKDVNTLLRKVVRAAGEQPAAQADWHLAAQRVTRQARLLAAPSEQSTRPNELPARPSDQSARPDELSAWPSEQPMRSSERAARSSEQPVRLSELSARPDELSAWSSEQPVRPSEQSARPDELSAWSSEQPSRLSEQSTQPSEPSARPGEMPVLPGEQPEWSSALSARSGEQSARPSEQSARLGEQPEWSTEPPSRPGEQPARAGEPPERSDEQPAAVRAELSAGELVSATAERMHEQSETDAATGLLNKEGLIRRLRAVRNGDRPVALTLVRLDGGLGPGRIADPGTRSAATDFELSELAGRVRNMAPEDAELARSDGAELAVVLPHTTRDQAEKLAARIESAWLGTANGHSISTGVVQSNPDATTVDARALINAARHALTPAMGMPSTPLPPAVDEDLTGQDANDTLRIGRAIISSLSIPDGSGGKRRAADAATEDTQEPATAGKPEAPDAANANTDTDTDTRNPRGTPDRDDETRDRETDAHLPDRSADRWEFRTDSAAPEPQGDTNTRVPDRGTEAWDFRGEPAARDPHGDTVGREPNSATNTGDPSANAEPQRGDETPEPFPGADSHASSHEAETLVADRDTVQLDAEQRDQGAEPDRDTEAQESGRGGGVSEPSGDPGGAEKSSGTGGEAARSSSSTYEQTKAELALLMSALAAGEVGDRPTPLPAPSRPTDDHARNGSTVPRAPRQTIPTPPEPDDVPEPERRPDIPDPAEPEPIPPAPPDPGPTSPGEPGPLTPPSADLPRREPRAHTSLDEPGSGTPPSADLPRRGPGAGSSLDEPGPLTAPGADLPRRESRAGSGLDEPGSASPSADLPRRGPRARTSRLAAAFRGNDEPRAAEPQPEQADRGIAWPGDTTRERPGERSDSTTIAGLLAEALAAYQETSDEAEKERQQNQPEQHKPDDDFDRLFDWRYQSPASGRHRSPE